MIDLQVQESFPKLKKEDQARLRDIVLTFLDRRAVEEPLAPDEILQMSDTVAEAFPDRRAETVAFGRLLNRLYEQKTPRKK